MTVFAAILVPAMLCSGAETSQHRCFSGIYPHLAYFNTDGECGTGAVVPWANRLWLVTYSPHKPLGSDDRLYEIDPSLNIAARPESVGGTPANRMVHRESNQLIIGPYFIDAERNIRVIPPASMPGRLTGTTRHLTDPANKVYFATMEEGLYEVNVHTLEVTQLYADNQNDVSGRPAGPDMADLPGYHGKGLYSGQGRVVYANNGEPSPLARTNPHIASGCLAQWDGRHWQVVRRNQFCEVSGPGGIYGNENPQADPVWSIGWDHRSLILMLLDGGRWHAFRLPKASHCYDGAHGWNTEWPRIREIGEDDLLMTMHGMLWRMPRTFSAGNTAGIAPRSTHLMVTADFCRWSDRIVFGCDVTAKSEFLNKRKAKGNIAGPGQSQSNIRFVEPGQLDRFGSALGRGAVWLYDPVRGGQPSEPFLFDGFQRRGVHLAHDSAESVRFTFETDASGNGQWSVLKDVTVPPAGYLWCEFPLDQVGHWIRIRTDRDCQHATAFFHYSNADTRPADLNPIFAGLAGPESRSVTGGLIRARGEGLKTLHFAAMTTTSQGPADLGYYEIDADMKLKRIDDPTAHKWLKENVAVPADVVTIDAASVLYIDDSGRRYRLPKGDPCFDQPGPLGPERIDREVVTERDLFNCHGTFYELPAENAGGFARIRPIATGNRRISDYCSWRGLLVMAGIDNDAPGDNGHIIHSDDGRCALWFGAVDDLWKLGKPRGQGGPWKDSPVRAGEPSDPYLMTGYDRKTLTLAHTSPGQVDIRVDVDIDGNGNWRPYHTFAVPAGQTITHAFPEAFSAYWVRTTASADTVATAQLLYE